MDKLERVLAAEEAARHTVADARERAEVIRSESRSHVRDIAAGISETAVAAAAEEREQIIGRATTEADELTTRAEVERREAIERARGRVDRAVRALVRDLRG